MNQKKKVEEFFDDYAKERSSALSTPAAEHIYRDLIERVVEKGGLDTSDVILDAGCGSGEHLELLESMGFENLHGFDISEGMVKIANRKCRYAKVRKSDSEDLDYPADFFDAVIAISLLMYLPEPEKGIKDIWKVLKKGGKLIVVNQNLKGSNIKNLITRKGKINLYSQPWNQDVEWTLENTKGLIEENGFRVLYARGFGFVLSRCPAALLRFNILTEKVLERTFFSGFGKDIIIIAEKI